MNKLDVGTERGSRSRAEQVSEGEGARGYKREYRPPTLITVKKGIEGGKADNMYEQGKEGAS